MLFLQRFVLADEALHMGLVTRVVPTATLETETLRLVHVFEALRHLLGTDREAGSGNIPKRQLLSSDVQTNVQLCYGSRWS